MIQQFSQHVDKNLPFLRGGKVLIAVSGGIDSVVLAHLCQELNIRIGLAHCNFGLRDKESDDDEEFVRLLSKTLLRPVYVKRFDTLKVAAEKGWSVQQAARELRYEWFYELKEKYRYDYICTAHQADDNLETFFINFLRGTGLDGLKGIPEVNLPLVRPMLPFSREQVEEYALKHRIKWREDSSNAEDKYLRNKIRQQLIPVVKELQPEILRNFGQTIQNLKASAALIENHTREIESAIFIKEGNGYRIPVQVLQKLEPRSAYLYAFFRRYGFFQVDELNRLLEGQSGKVLYAAQYRLFKDRDYLFLLPLEDTGDKGAVAYEVKKAMSRIVEPLTLSFTETKTVIPGDSNRICLDASKLNYPLKLRKWEEGDYFYPFGMQGKKKLSKFFKDEKYNLKEKEEQWLLCNGDGKIIWVVGKRADDRFKVDSGTSSVLCVELHEG